MYRFGFPRKPLKVYLALFFVISLCSVLYVSIFFQEGKKNFPEREDGREVECKFVLSSYIFLSPEQKLMKNEPNTILYYTCSYILSVLSSFGINVDLRIIGWKSLHKFDGYISKVKAARVLAQSLDPKTILMMTDAFDVVVQKRISCEFLRTFLETKHKGKMVFVGEKQCYPLSRRKYAKGEACKDYLKKVKGKENTLTSKLNGGSWVGFAGDIVRACDILISNFELWKPENFRSDDYHRIVKRLPTIKNAAGQDQYGFAVLYLYGNLDIIAIDTDSEIFITESGYLQASGENRTITDNDGFLFDTLSKSYPPVIHFNAGKPIYQSKLLSLPWMKESQVPENIMRMKIYLGPDIDDNEVKPLEYREICPTRRTASEIATPGKKKSETSLAFADFDKLHLLFSQKYCSFLIRECVNISDKYRINSLEPMPKLAYFNASMYFPETYYKITHAAYSLLPSIPEYSWGRCAFVASGSIKEKYGAKIDSHDTVFRLSTHNLYKARNYRGSKVDVLIIKPHRRRFNHYIEPLEKNLNYYWEPSPVFTYGSPSASELQKNKNNKIFPKLLRGRPILKTIVNYNYNSHGSPPYPVSDLASDYVEKLFQHIAKERNSTLVASSGFRFLVQLIMSSRCTSVSAFGFSGLQGPTHFSKVKEHMSFWHDPELELNILKEWTEFNELKSKKFRVYL